MIDISRKTYGGNGIKTIVDNDGTLWLNEKRIEEGLDHKNLRENIIKYYPDRRKHRYELDNEKRKQCNRTFLDETLAVKVIMDCRTRFGS